MTRSDRELDERLQIAVKLAEQAGQGTLKHFQQPRLAVERKSDNSPVTIADQEAEKFLRAELLRAFPDDSFIGEEYGEIEGSSGYCWVADPIDGTKSFISGVPLYSTLLGLLFEGESLAGVIVLPALDECVYAARGRGAWFRKGTAVVKAQVSHRTSLRDAIFVTSQVDSFSRRNAAGAFQALQERAYVTRTWGDGYGYALIATGRADVMVDPAMNLWDAAAILPVIEEAGGRFTDWQGNRSIRSGEGLATTPSLLDEVLQITRSYPKPS